MKPWIGWLWQTVFIGADMCWGERLVMSCEWHLTLRFEVDGQWKIGSLKRTWKKQVEEERAKVGLSRNDALC